MISLQRSMHSSQMYTPGPAMSFLTCFCDFPQKEHFSRSPPSPIRATYVSPCAHRPTLTGPGLRTTCLVAAYLVLHTAHRLRMRVTELHARRYPLMGTSPTPQNGRVRGQSV